MKALYSNRFSLSVTFCTVAHFTPNAGDKKGLNDPRSGLWREMFRIINQCRPAIALIENPTGLLSRGMATVLEDLSQIRYPPHSLKSYYCLAA
ncbi:DNA cytosine methyltransferase [Nostoc sp. CHAB 5834]|nr:DNA cytosine methyltransferase [Nostoc sp. CHAB 5834]